MSLYFVRFRPMACAAMRLSRMAMIARPARERVRFSTTMSVIITRMKPAVNVAIVAVPVAPCAPLMIAVPEALRPRSSTVLLPAGLKMKCRPFSS